MYLTIAILGALFFLALFSQFGSRLPARHALTWWVVCALILSAALVPELYQRLAHAMGVSLGSNLIFAGLILLLIFLLVEQSVELTRVQRLVRDGATLQAAQEYLAVASPAWPAKGGPKVLVVLPAYNEAATLKSLAGELKALAERSDFPLDYCFIDDGSQDDSAERLRACATGHFASHRQNMGVAAALLTGIRIAELRGADYLVQCDADGQHPVGRIAQLVAAAEQGRVDLVVGSRYVGSDAGAASTTRWRRMGAWLIALALRGLRFPARISDPTSGFRAYSRRAFRFLSRYMPEEYPEPETIALLAWAGMKIQEVAVPMASRQEGVSTIRGLKTMRYMTKVLGALLGLRLRILFSPLR